MVLTSVLLANLTFFSYQQEHIHHCSTPNAHASGKPRSVQHPSQGIVSIPNKGQHLKTNYVLIDYENVQPATIAVLDQAHFKIIVFVGANQTKITFAVASALQQAEPRAKYLKIAGNGSNVLDFHIAFYLGHLAAQEPDAYFHIISKDTGFDPLIEHLMSKKVRVCRSYDVTDIPVVKATHATSLGEKVAVVITILQQRGAAKPRTTKTLASTINALLQKSCRNRNCHCLCKSYKRAASSPLTTQRFLIICSPSN